jgi:hypothetical protein
MPQSFGHGTEVLDFIYELKGLGSPSAILASMHQAVAQHGSEKTLLFMGLPGRGQRFEDVVLGKHWPEEWTINTWRHCSIAGRAYSKPRCCPLVPRRGVLRALMICGLY